MSSSKPLFRNSNISPNKSLNDSKCEERKFSVFEKINLNNLNNYYQNDESFKKKVDKQKQKFYIETDKFITLKSDIEKSQDHLFLLLFEQVSIYVEEIERLNLKLKEKVEDDENSKIKLEESSKKENFDKEINIYKSTIKNMEKQMLEIKQNEEKLKKENFLYQRQVIQYKDHLNFELASRSKYVFNGEKRPTEKLSTKDTKEKSCYTTANDTVSPKKRNISKVKNFSSSLTGSFSSKDSPLNVTSQFNDTSIVDMQVDSIKNKDVTELSNIPKHSSNYAQRRSIYVARRNSSINACKNDSPNVRRVSIGKYQQGCKSDQLLCDVDVDVNLNHSKSEKFEDEKKFKNSQLKDLVRKNLDEELEHLEKEEIFLASLKNDLCNGEMEKLISVQEDFDLLSSVGYDFGTISNVI